MSTRRPRVRTVSGRSVVKALDGTEKPYPVYRFSRGRDKYERPKHNPFSGLINGLAHSDGGFMLFSGDTIVKPSP